MAGEIVSQFLVTYDGRDASRSVLEGQTLGESIYGSAKFYTAVAHYCMFGFVPRGRYKREFAAYAQPAKTGSWDQVWFVAPLAAGEYAIHAHIYNEAIGYIFGKVCDEIKNVWTRPSDVQAVIDRLAATLEAQARSNADVHSQLVTGLVRANDNLASLQSRLIDTLPALATATRPFGVRLVAPIGVTCSTILQFADTPLASLITEPEAVAIRGEGDMEVDPLADYRVTRIKEINVETGHCIIDVVDVGEVVGKITDPSLDTANNVYTRALDQQTGCTVSAKAVRRNGAIRQLFISDARP